jgi:hypothetical protein
VKSKRLRAYAVYGHPALMRQANTTSPRETGTFGDDQMKTVSSFNFGGSSTSARGKHDWDSFLNGSIWVIEPGIDYTCKTTAFLTLARLQAKKRGMKLRTGKDGSNIVIQAYASDEPHFTVAPEEVAADTDEVVAEAVVAEAEEAASQQPYQAPKRSRKK